MKNSLTFVICLLIILIVVLLMFNGLSIGNFKILSISQIIQNNENLDKEIDDLNNLKNSVYRKKLSDLEVSTKDLSTSKQEYLDVASVSTQEEIRAATLVQTYSMEYLWSKLGGYATKQGVNLKLEVQTSDENNDTLKFTVKGSYVGIINYLTAIEDDGDLGFRIEQFKISSVDSEELLTASFNVSNVRIKEETVTTPVTVGEDNSTSETENTNSNNVNS